MFFILIGCYLMNYPNKKQLFNKGTIIAMKLIKKLSTMLVGLIRKPKVEYVSLVRKGANQVGFDSIEVEFNNGNKYISKTYNDIEVMTRLIDSDKEEGIGTMKFYKIVAKTTASFEQAKTLFTGYSEDAESLTLYATGDVQKFEDIENDMIETPEGLQLYVAKEIKEEVASTEAVAEEGILETVDSEVEEVAKEAELLDAETIEHVAKSDSAIAAPESDSEVSSETSEECLKAEEAQDAITEEDSLQKELSVMKAGFEEATASTQALVQEVLKALADVREAQHHIVAEISKVKDSFQEEVGQLSEQLTIKTSDLDEKISIVAKSNDEIAKHAKLIEEENSTIKRSGSKKLPIMQMQDFKVSQELRNKYL